MGYLSLMSRLGPLNLFQQYRALVGDVEGQAVAEEGSSWKSASTHLVILSKLGIVSFIQ